MITLSLLKTLTAEQTENGFGIPEGYDVPTLLPPVLEGLGSSNSKIRELSYTVINDWLWSNKANHFSDEALLALAEKLSGNLFVDLGESNSDAGYLRAFSSLNLGDIIGLDGDQKEGRKFLSKSQLDSYFEKTLTYFKGEVDCRGYVSEENGWLHAIAHASDLLMHFANHPETSVQQLQGILDAISYKVRDGSLQVFLFSEDERLVNAAITVMKRSELGLPEISSWLEALTEPPQFKEHNFDAGLQEYIAQHPWWPAPMELKTRVTFINTQNFVRSLYCQLKLGNRPETLNNYIASVEEAIKRLDTGFLPLD